MPDSYPPLARALCGLVLLFTLAGCASPPVAEPSRGLARIARTGELRIGMSGEQPPLTMTTRNGELIGLDVAIARVLGQSMGVETRFVQLPFGRLLDALEDGEVDVVMSGMTITPRRSARAIFVGPYYSSGKSILTRSKSLAEVELAQELNAPELRLAALAGSTSESFVRESLPRAKLVLSERLEGAIRKVIAGEVDALVADRETCAFAALRHPDAGLRTSSRVFTIEPMGIAVPADDPRLANLIESYLTALRDRGALERATAFWFGDSSWVDDLR